MRWQGQLEKNVTFWENAWWNHLWQDFKSLTWSCMEIHSLKDLWHLRQGLHDHWEGLAVILELHKSFWGTASWGKGQNQFCSLLSHKSSPNSLQISAWVKDQRCIHSFTHACVRVCMQQLRSSWSSASLQGMMSTELSIHASISSEAGTCYWEIRAVKLRLHF